MLTRIRHVFDLGAAKSELIILPNVKQWMPKFQFRILPRGDIYEGRSYIYNGCHDVQCDEVDRMFKITPVMSAIGYGAITFTFKDHSRGYDYVTANLYKLSDEEARKQWADAAAADQIINHILTARIKKLEQRISILEKIK